MNKCHTLFSGSAVPADLHTKTLVMDENLAGREAESLRRSLPQAKTLLLVMDKNTRQALGARVEGALAKEFHTETLLLKPAALTRRPIEADLPQAARIEHAARHADALVAIGGGTINDLCKYVSFRQNKPYAVFPTAPSMNGYLSANASITADGHKKTLPAHMPALVLVDLSVLANAPPRLIRAGLGDLLCRATAQGDWYLSHRLLDTPYDDTPFLILKDAEARLLRNPEGTLHGDLTAMEALMECLLLSGVGMTLAGGSYPASQGEHMIAHMMHMAGHGKRTLHGEEIAVTTRTMTALQHRHLDTPPRLNHRPPDEGSLQQFLGRTIAAECLQSYAAKQLTPERVAELNDRIANEWGDIARTIRAFSLPPERMDDLWSRLGLPQTPQDIGWNPKHYAQATRLASLMRDRFTFLDIEYMR